MTSSESGSSDSRRAEDCRTGKGAAVRKASNERDLGRAEPGLVVVGAGPAGLAPLFAAATVGQLPELLDRGVTILEQSDRVGAGGLASYTIASDSTADTFLDIVRATAAPQLRALQEHPAARALKQIGKQEAPLQLAAELLQAASEVLCTLVATSRRGSVLTHAQALCIREGEDGRWHTRFRRGNAPTEEIVSDRVLLATGAHQPVSRLFHERVGGTSLLPCFGHKLLQSGVVLTQGGAEIIRRRLVGIKNPKISIVGGSTSAAATAVMLLRDLPDVVFGEGGIQVLHRSAIKHCYESVAEAVAAGDNTFTSADVCPLTQKVNRFSGLRLTSRDLFMRVQGLGHGLVEKRLQLVPLQTTSSDAVMERLEAADLIIAALGYRPSLLPIADVYGRSVQPHEPTREDWAMVDERFRVRRKGGAAFTNLYASGLAVGPVPDRGLGGEAGFRGQVNSLWMWQHNQGLRLLNEILSPSVVPYAEQRPMALPPVEPSVPASVSECAH